MTNPLDVSKLRAYHVPETRHVYGQQDTILYALGVGAGLSDIDETSFVFEDNLVALPTMALVLGTPGFWLTDPATGLDWINVLHGEQSLVLHRPLRAEEDIIGRTQIGELVDKGPGRAAMLQCTRTLSDYVTGSLVASLKELWVLRGAGGFGGESQSLPSLLPAMPERPADDFLDLPTARNQAMLYRHTGDRNPLHIDPEVASRAGFNRPILHGLSTMGLVARAIVHRCCGGNPALLRAIHLRFTAPVLPGDVVRTELWQSEAKRGDGQVRFRARVPDRGVTVIEGGLADTRGFAVSA